MTEGSDESEGEKSISTEVEEDERTDAEEQEGNDDPTLERLEVQLEEDSDLIRSDGDNGASETKPSSDEERRQDEDCPFCDYMRLGPCGDSFTAWEKCTEAAEQGGSDVFEKCNFVTGTLTACMRANRNYYGPVLEAQKRTNDDSLDAEHPVKVKHDTDNDITSENTEKQLDAQDQVAEADDEL